jgi:hypothetical protein
MPLVLGSLRLYLLIGIFDSSISWRNCYGLVLVGQFFNVILPGTVTGDLFKGYYLSRQARSVKTSTVIATMVMDRFLGLSAMILLSGIALVWSWAEQSGFQKVQYLFFPVSLLNALILTLLVILTTFSKRPLNRVHKILQRLPLGTHLSRLLYAAQLFGKNSKRIQLALCISAVAQGFAFTALALIANSLGSSSLAISTLMLILPIGILISAIPVAPAGIGVGHAAFTALFALFDSKIGADVFSIWAILMILWGLIGSIPFLFLKRTQGLEKAVSL